LKFREKNIKEDLGIYDFTNLKSINYSFIQKSKNSFYPFLLQFSADILSIIFSFIFQYIIRFETGLINSDIKSKIYNDPMLLALPLVALIFYWIILFFFSGLYKNWFERSPFDEIFTILKITFFGTSLFFISLMLNNTRPRLLFLIHFFIFSTTTILFRTLARRFQRKLRKNKIINFPSLIIGNSKDANELLQKITSHPDWGYNILGVLDSNFITKLNQINEDYFIDKLNMFKPETIIIAKGLEDTNKLMMIANICSFNNIKLKIEPDLYHIFTGQTKAQNIYGIPFIEISTQILKPWQEVAKRIFDVVFSVIVLVLGSPFWLLTMLIIRIESKGNTIFKQERVGKDGKIFKIYKFRSMISEEEQLKRNQWTIWTAVNDPRVTKFGKFIRKTHLDEVPQFFNVLIGDMSVVGPRPENAKLMKEFTEEVPSFPRRLKVRPGITGWWQIKYTTYEFNIQEIENRLKDDFYYIENMSIRFDIEIIIRTVWCVIKGHGQA
jgi:exopolysaccharide biosynthesis polyprenyl glycosylphosphotransferase